MDEIINIGIFIQHLTYYLKIGVYINKGTDKDQILETCIKLYNKYKAIEQANLNNKISDDDETFVRRCLKRLNLILKIDSDGNPVNIRNKENQLKMVYFEGHASLSENDMASMIEYANQNNINILQDVPLLFVLRESKFQELLWQYTRSLFYISQVLISRVDPESNQQDKNVIAKKRTYDDAMGKLEEILAIISETEEKIEINKIMSVDKYLNSVLLKTGINEKNVNEAKAEVKEIFAKKGLNTDNAMTRMIDSISNKLTSIDLSQGNIIQSMFGIAQDVAQEMRPELEDDPEKFQNTLGAITEVFQEAMDDSSKKGEEVPAELRNMFNTILATGANPDKEATQQEIEKSLESIIQANGLNREQFYGAIKDDDGQFDVSKLENMLVGINNNN